MQIQQIHATANTKHIRIKVRHSGRIYDEYSKNEADYTVVSLPYEDQTLETKDKVMLYDMTVKQIPFTSVSNPADGLTVYIGTGE